MSGLRSQSQAAGQFDHADIRQQAYISINSPPTAGTIAFTYTVGAGRLAFLECLFGWVGSTAVEGQAFVVLRVIRNLLSTDTFNIYSVVGSKVTKEMTCNIILFPGDQIQLIYGNNDGVNRIVVGGFLAREIIP